MSVSAVRGVTMRWVCRFRCSAFLRASLCIVPIACMAAALLAAPGLRWLDDQTRWTLLGFGAEGARAAVGALASSLLTFIVFAFSIILLAVQMASGQLSPRIIRWIFESRSAKATLGVFVFSFTYAVAALGRIEERVPQLPVLVAILSSLGSVALFLYLIQEVSRNFRPVVILARVADDTRRVIERIYPRRFSPQGGGRPEPGLDPALAERSITHGGASGYLLDFDRSGLIDIGARAGCVIELVPQSGDFVAHDAALFRLYGTGAETVREDSLRRCVALGHERNLENDPAFGLRILADIAIKALSPTINDPTTGVLAIDQLQHLLRTLGQRQLDAAANRDASGAVRLVYRTPGWEDFVLLAVTEIRLCGAASPQVTRRLQAMLDQLAPEVPAERARTLRQEMARLRRTIDAAFSDPEDRSLAGVGDLQGFGSRLWTGEPGRHSNAG